MSHRFNWWIGLSTSESLSKKLILYIGVMKKLILLLFIPLVSFSQQITVTSTDDESFVFSQETLDYLTNEWSQLSENPQLGLFQSFSAITYFDFDEDGFKDVIVNTAISNYAENVICIFFWDEASQKYIENNQYMMLVQGEASLWDDSVGDFNGDGLNDVYVPVSNYHGEEGQQPDYYPYENASNMPGHLFLNNGSGFDSQFIDTSIHDGYGYPNYERGFALDIDNDDVLDIIVPSVNQHPENTPANNFLATKYNVTNENEITYELIYQWEDTYNTSSGFYMQSHSVVVTEYNDKIYILYQGNETPSSNGYQYATPEVSVYSKEIDDNGDFILLDKFRLERGGIVNQDGYVNRETFYINDLDGDGDEEFVIQMFTIDAVPHGGLHVFDHTGQEITQDWFIEDAYLGHSANGFYCEDLNNDGYKDLIMVDVFTENAAETVIYLNNGEQFIQKTIELDGSGWCYPIDVNNDGFFELLKFDVAQTQQTEITFGVGLNYLDYTDALSLEDSSFNKIYLHPNPSSDFVHIKGTDKELEAIVTDILGKQVMRVYIKDKLDISILEKGIYIVNLTDGINSTTHKIIKD